ncbi:uncharacterized protein LOC123291444 [Chrysoperla carnea]|uniref:uncharacterized protein LOC123291444 n=1 Tax=Chrysoperla carnea TaxID=189513 RepID=UPI001D064295|nr:uncharacterized protein LOC123291444 [Chrysoperla carnea]
MSRLKLLKTKEQELINESVICNSLISQVLAKINTSIKKLEVEDNKPEFRSLYLSTLCLTDKINEKLVEINLDLEEFISDKQIDTNELDISTKASNINLLEENTTPKVLNIDKECLPGDNAASLAGNSLIKQECLSDEISTKVHQSNSPYKTGNMSDENTSRKIKKSNPVRKEKLQFERNIVDDPGEDVRICKQPASLTPASFLNRNVKKNTRKSDKNSNIHKKHYPPIIIPGNPPVFSQQNSYGNVDYENKNQMYEQEVNTNQFADLVHGNARLSELSKVRENIRENERYQVYDQACRRNCENETSKEINRDNDVGHYKDESPRRIPKIDSSLGKFDGTLYSDREKACKKHKDIKTQYQENITRKNYEDKGRVEETSYMTEENVARKNYEDERLKDLYIQENVNSDNYEDETAMNISKRKVMEFLNPSDKSPSRRGRFSEQKRAIANGPPGFKKSSLASSISTNEAHKNWNLFSATDSYDSYESDRNFEEANNDKDFNTEKQKDSMNSLPKFERVNQIGSPPEEKFPVKDCDVELTRNKVVESVKSHTETEECQENVLEIPAPEALELARAIQVPQDAQNLPKVTIENDDRCIVTHAKSPVCFYIITATATENINDYDRFHEELQTYCESNARKFSNKNEIKASKAHYYCCFNKMEDYNYNWFRCKIIDWLDDDEINGNRVRVLAVDDGFENDVMIDQLRDYPQTKYLLPEMAVKCRLRYLYPSKSTKNHILEQWPQGSIEFFNDLIQNSRINPFYVTDVYRGADCYEVDLCNNQRISLSRVMVELGFAVIIEPDTVGAESDKLVTKSDKLNDESDKLDVEPIQINTESEHQLVESDFMKEQIKQAQGFTITNNDENPLDNLEDCKTNLNEAICDHMEGGYTPTDYTRLCKFTEKDGEKCFKGDNCHFEHKIPDPDGWTSDKVRAFTVTSEIDEPKIGDQLTIMVTFIKTVCRFYAHIKPSKQKRQMYSASKIIHTANQFSKYINKPENINCLKKLKILPAEGQLVIARSPDDDKWYRARVLNVCSEDEFDVIFIDYGDDCTVRFNDLREIQHEHLGLPEQAVEFRISGIDPINTRDPEYMFKAAKHFADFTIDHVLTALVINTGYPIEVEIYTDEGVNIGNYLKMQNLAKDRDTSYLPKVGQMALE